MKDARHIALVAVLALMLVFAGGVAGWKVRGGKVQPPVADTIRIERVDTVTLVEPMVDTVIRIVNRLYPVAVHDTTLITQHTTDSFFISLPYQYRFYSKPDTIDVWYSGVDPKIDSINLYYHHTTEIINHIADISKTMPCLTAELGVAAFYHDKQVFPLLVGEIAYNAKHTTFSAIGGVDHQGRWGAGASVTYRFNLIK